MPTRRLNIANGLKIAARIAGKLKVAQLTITSHNTSTENSVKPLIPVRECERLVDSYTKDLISLKAAIQVANSGVLLELVALSEAKASLTFWNGVNDQSRTEKERIQYRDQTASEIVWKAEISAKEIQTRREHFQQEVNRLQDIIDEYNAKTFFEVELSVDSVTL